MERMDTTKHSWYNMHAHIFRTDGRVVRAKLQDIVMENGGIYIAAHFTEKGKNKYKHVSPITIAALQLLWINVDVVSDVELPDDIENSTNFIPPKECDRLPRLEMEDDVNLEEFEDAFKCLKLQVDSFLQIPAGEVTIHDPDDFLSLEKSKSKKKQSKHRKVKDKFPKSRDP